MDSFLQVEHLTKSFGDKILFEDISFGLQQGQRTALIAKNGAGKTTLLNILYGKENYDSGQITFRKDIRVAFLEQEPLFSQCGTVLDVCFRSDSELVGVVAEYERLLSKQGKQQLSKSQTEEFDCILRKMDKLQAWNFESRIKQILGKLKIHQFDQPVSTLSGGQKKRLALANVLISEPDMLILDEPTNHLDLEMVEWLEDFLSRSRITILMVTHDRYFLDRVCHNILEIDNGELFQYKGNYSYYLEKREERVANYNAETLKYKNIYRRELEWMRRQPQARATKAQSRIDAFGKIENRAKQRLEEKKMVLKLKSLYVGSKIFEAQYVSKSFGDLKILDQFYYNFSRFEKMGIVGGNGTGKSTFLKLLLGIEPPDSGRFDIGETIKFGYYSQDGLQFDEQKKVIDVIRDVAEVVDLGGGKRLTASQFLTHFMFSPATQQNYVYKLSGGERRRLYLCSVLMQNPNFLVLDEPTNDLDIATLNTLEDYLINFQGCVIVVSHDRFFMDKVVDHLLVFKGNAEIRDFPGNYTDYRQWAKLKEAEDKEIAEQNKKKNQTLNLKNEDTKIGIFKKKRTFKEQREFEQLEAEIEAMEAEKKELEQKLSLGIMALDEITEISNRFAQLNEQIDEKTTRWLELSEK